MDLNLEHEYTLNGDGSGKVELRWDGPQADVDPREFMSQEVARAKGVDAWDGLSCGVEDGRLRFKATAWFPKLDGLRFHCQGLHVGMLDFTAFLDGEGNFVIENPGGGPSAVPAETASDDELRAKIAEERAKFEQVQGFLQEFLGGLNCTSVFHMPGKILEAKNLKKGDARTARSQFRGDDLLKVLGRFMEDDELVLRVMKSPAQGPDALMGMLPGQGPVRVVSEGGDESAFPYAEEVEQARARFEETAASLGLSRGPERAQPLANPRVVAAKVVRETDPEREFSPLNESQPCVVLTLAGELSGPALKLEEAALEGLTDTAGNNLLPESDWDRKIHFPKLTKDGGTAFFDVAIKADPSTFEGFLEIHGVLSALVAGKVEDVDLGFESLEAGAEGKELGARLERLETGDDDRTALDLKLGIARERVEKVSLLTGKGKEFPMSPQGYSSCNDEVTFTYDIEGKPPKKARLVARVAKEVRTFLVPFGVANVDLLGRPLK
jgi:hypothetical protein